MPQFKHAKLIQAADEHVDFLHFVKKQLSLQDAKQRFVNLKSIEQRRDCKTSVSVQLLSEFISIVFISHLQL